MGCIRKCRYAGGFYWEAIGIAVAIPDVIPAYKTIFHFSFFRLSPWLPFIRFMPFINLNIHCLLQYSAFEIIQQPAHFPTSFSNFLCLYWLLDQNILLFPDIHSIQSSLSADMTIPAAFFPGFPCCTQRRISLPGVSSCSFCGFPFS